MANDMLSVKNTKAEQGQLASANSMLTCVGLMINGR